MNTRFLIIPVLLAVSACRMEVDGSGPVLQDGVYAEIPDPQRGNSDAKSLSVGFEFSFQENDGICVFPSSGSEYMIYRLTPSKGAPDRAYFLVDNFSLRDGRYYALYPASAGVLGGEVSVSFSGQHQETNNSTTHLSGYDFCLASSDISDNSGCFRFTHEVSWVRIRIPAGENNNSFRSASVSAQEGVASSMSLDVRAGVASLPDADPGDAVEVLLGGESGLTLAQGDTLTVYAALPPSVYSGLAVTTVSAGGEVYTYEFPGSHEFVKGHYYSMNVGVSDVVELTSLECPGLYRCHGDNGRVYVWEKAKKYREGVGQVSWYRSPSLTQFEFFELGTRDFMSFNVSSGSLSVGDTYGTTIYSGEGTVCEDAGFKVVKISDTKAWLLDREDGLGCILRINE